MRAMAGVMGRRDKWDERLKNILAKILNINDGKKNRGAVCLTNRRKGWGEEVCHWSKEVCYMIVGTTRRQEQAMVETSG